MNYRWTLIPLAVACLCCCIQSGAYPKPEDAAKPGDPGNLKEITNSIGMKLVLIPKGTFAMGSPPNEVGARDDERQHEVNISLDYYLGAYEVTQAQYKKVMGENPSHFQGDNIAERHPQTKRVVKDVDSSNHPVETVSWVDAAEFCIRLSALPEEMKAGRVYRLPTEAEWEYGCRAGSKTAYGYGNNSHLLGDYAWFEDNSGPKTHAVGQKKPNAWGLYDMHGNVWEWCGDWYDATYYAQSPKDNPKGPLSGSIRVGRGGSWINPADLCRSAYRRRRTPGGRDFNLGFRVSAGPSEIK